MGEEGKCEGRKGCQERDPEWWPKQIGCTEDRPRGTEDRYARSRASLRRWATSTRAGGRTHRCWRALAWPCAECRSATTADRAAADLSREGVASPVEAAMAIRALSQAGPPRPERTPPIFPTVLW